MEKKCPGKNPKIIKLQAASRSLPLSPSKIIEHVTDVEVQLIEPVQYISDFQTSSNSHLPLVIQSGEHFYCIDGWHKVQAASEDATTITCRVNIKNEPLDPSALAIEKAAVRMSTKLGKVSYAEQLLAVRQLYKFLKSNRPNLVENNHGGTRVAGESTGNPEDDLYSVLVKRLDKDRTTIQKYISNSKYLTDESMAALIVKGATQKFFDAAKRRWNNVANDLKSDGTSDEDITAYVSAEIINWHQEYIDNDRNLPSDNPLPPPDQLPDNPGNNSNDDNGQQTVEEFNFHTPLMEDVSLPLRSFQDYMADFTGIQDRVLDKRNDVENNSSLKALIAEMLQELLELDALIPDATEGDGENQQTSEVA